MKLFYNALFAGLLLVNGLHGQDQHFTQFFAAPLTLNPALSGAFNGNYRLGMIYRDQGGASLEDPYLTVAATLDLRFDSKITEKKTRDAFGAGLLFYNDRVPNFDLSTNQMLVSGAYHKSLGRSNTQYLSFGFQLGIAQRNIGYENLTFEDQFDGTSGYSIPTEENLPENNFSFTDMAAGLNYTYTSDQQVALFAGFAIHHFHEPQISFFFDRREDQPRGDNTLLPKITSYLSFQIPLGESVQLHPRGLFYKQGEHLAINAGSNIRFQFSDITGSALHLGGWVRPVKYEDSSLNLDAAILMTGIEFRNFLLGISYDLNLRSVNIADSRQGALEISIAYLGNYSNEAILCPSF